MTSSNAASTDEGRAAAAVVAAMASPKPVLATSPSLSPGSRPHMDGDAAATAVPTSGASDANSKLTTIDAPATTAPSDTRSQTGFVGQQSPSADLPDHHHNQQPQQQQPPHDQPPNEADIDISIPSPPTVSPLSTPAATNINVDGNLSDDAVTKLTSDLPPLSLSRDSLIFRSGIFGPSQSTSHKAMSGVDGMELDEPFAPDQMDYHRRSQVEAIATTDPDPHSTEYASHNLRSHLRLSQGSIEPSAYVMNPASQAALYYDHGPSVVHPSEVSLQDSDVLTGSVEPTSTSESQKLESFAQIEFADSTFQMTTYAVIIGRDKQAMEQARADERREAAYRRKCEENERNGLPPPTPVMYDRGKFSKSYVSEEGGMLGPEHSDGEDVKPVKRRRSSSAAQPAAGEDNMSGNHAQSNRQYVSHTPGAAAVDLGALQPSPGHIPFIGIHSPGPDIASKTRGISRQHLKIQFNKKRGVFEGIALHKNGFFCQDVLYGLDQPATLRSGDRLQIKDVEFFFEINGVQTGMSGGDDEDVGSNNKRMSVGGKEMSLDFEHSDHENFRDTSEELSDVEDITTPAMGPEHEEGEPEVAPAPLPAAVPAAEPKPGPGPEPEREVTGGQTVTAEEQLASEMIKPELDILGELPPDFTMPEIPKRRGPGRPPKDGIMSKRERRLLKKQMMETSRKTIPQDTQEEKIKRPVGRPRKNPLPEDNDRPEKRKYNKKKREDGEEGSDIEKRTKEKKDKKVRPKSPPLDLRIEDYTNEQLQKPTKNYGVLIDEALTNGPPDGLTLKQIYKRITARYPWFYFSAETKGWESSVRHNLIGNEAFKKDEETGLWSRVPGVELDAGKKRKANSPDRHLGPSHLHSHLSHPPYYQNSAYANPTSGTYPHGLPNYSTEQKHAQSSYVSTAQNAQQLHATPSQPTTQQAYAAHAPAPAQLPPGYGSVALPRPSNTSQQSTYSSPYARPPPSSNPPARPDTNMSNSQAPAPSSTPQAVSQTQPPQPAQPAQSRATVTSLVPREHLTPDIERAITQFSANMLNVISKQTPHAASIIEAAANRIRGLPVHNRVAGFESVEATLINAMQGMIRDMTQKKATTSASPAPSAPVQTSSTPSPAPSNTVEAEIQRRLRNFRESMVTALKTKTDKAEVIVDSAINRARGFPHAGKIPGWEEADKLMVKSVTQIIAEARSAHNLKQQNASPSPANTSRTVATQPVQHVPQTVQPAQPAIRKDPPPTPASVQTPVTSTVPHVPPSNSTPAAAYTSAVHPPGTMTPSSSFSPMTRPGMPLQRPAPVALTRPPTTTSTMARPAVFHKEAATPSSSTLTTGPAAPRPNVSSPAPPSAGVLDQITGHKRFTDDAFHKHPSTNSNAAAIGHLNSHTGGNSTTPNNAAVNIVGVNNAKPSSTINTVPSSIPAVNMAPSPSNNPPGNAIGKAATSDVRSNATGNSTNSSTGKLTSVAPISTASNPTGSAPNNTASHSTTSATGGILGGSMSSCAGGISSASVANVNKSNTAYDTVGKVPGIVTSQITSGETGKSSSSNYAKAAATDTTNHTTVNNSDGPKASVGGPSPDPKSGSTGDGSTNANINLTPSTTVGHITNGPTSKAMGDQSNNSVGSMAASGKAEGEKSIPGKATPMEHHEPAALKAPMPVHNMSSPAPPSAGVVDQIAGHKRSLEEGPGSASAEQPEPKRLGVSPA